METFSKFNDINAVISKANDILPKIKEEYQKCLREENIPDSLLVDIKDYLGNLRSALDYLWYKIPGVSTGYFPIANSAADFSAKTSNIDQQYLSLLKKYQDYNQNSWIRCFGLFRNKNTHVTLIPQKRSETKEFSVKKTGASDNIATFRGCTFGGNGNHISIDGVPMPIDLKSQFPADTQGLDINRIIWVDFLFDGSSISPDFPQGISALPFLEKSLSSVLYIIKEIEKLLW